MNQEGLDILILAAGYSKRMGLLSKNTPKSLIPVNGSTLLDNLINEIRKIKYKNIYIILGFKANIIFSHLQTKYPDIKFNFIRTNLFYKRGHAYSLLLGLKQIKKNENLCLVIHADTYVMSNFFTRYMPKNFFGKSYIFLGDKNIKNLKDCFFFNVNENNQKIEKKITKDSVGIISGVTLMNRKLIEQYVSCSMSENFTKDLIYKNWEYYVNWILKCQDYNFEYILLQKDSCKNINYPEDFLNI